MISQHTKPNTAGSFIICVGMPITTGLTDLAQLGSDVRGMIAVPDAVSALDVLNAYVTDRVAIMARDETGSFGTPRSTNNMIGPLQVDEPNRRVLVHGIDLHFSPLDFKLLVALGSRIGLPWSYDELSTQVWGSEYLGDPDPIASAIRRLRRRLDGIAGVTIATVRSVGYRLDVADQAQGLATAR